MAEALVTEDARLETQHQSLRAKAERLYKKRTGCVRARLGAGGGKLFRAIV
eukprot:CAMPEP_0180414352 /NCGR_PEP_ID=MMETSP0989-20121125/45586_1 /TAXON_ID=697907 /ORGANISM="non described non described, Strain CCMP2293" /LENGTH=50 /DNA_ID=CAMNT_0022418995 /DNA_START=11 /DNA_END=160 /DNA_ORIENTATION=+